MTAIKTEKQAVDAVALFGLPIILGVAFVTSGIVGVIAITPLSLAGLTLGSDIYRRRCTYCGAYLTFKNVAYPFNYKAFDSIVTGGSLR